MARMNRHRFSYLPLFLLICGLTIFSNCERDKILTDPSAMLDIPQDTLTFDTLFTVIGSATRFVKVFNTFNQSLNISEAFLAGGENSKFRINIDGIPSSSAQDLEILPNDSLYFFVEVTVDPTEENLPFVVEDSIILFTNGNRQKIVLNAYGQNANFYNADTLSCSTTWIDTLPYVIFNYVLIDSLCELTIEEGSRIHFYNGAGILNKGILNVQGSPDSIVTFLGTRLDAFEEVPGQWTGILNFRGSTSLIEYAEIKNSIFGIYNGLHVSPLNDFTFDNRPVCTVRNTIIKNASIGINNILAELTVENSLIYNMNQYNIAVTLGGIYNITHSTLANYSGSFVSHKTEILGVSNCLVDNEELILYCADLDQLNISNSILYGGLEEELALVDTLDSVPFNYEFTNNIIRTEDSTVMAEMIDNLYNIDPGFIDVFDQDYHIAEFSAARDNGLPGTMILNDLENNTRDAMPDIGCYEYSE